MSVRRYDTYKESGVDWFDELPDHWSMPPLYARYEQVLGKMLDQNKMTGEHPMPYVRNVDVQWDEVNAEDLPVIDIEPSERERFTVNKGDLLICEGGEVGRTAIWNGECGNVAFQKAIHRLRPLDGTEDVRFFYYLMRFATGMQVFLASSNPNTIPHLTGEQLRGYRLPKPSLDEQKAISSFLDVETSKIDGLVSEQRRLIELLKEKRQAVISHAVTKGLNPNAPMKPSGIQWLGDVPQHWDMQRGRYLYEKRELAPEHEDGVVTSFRDGQVTLRVNRRTDGFTMAVLETGYQRVLTGDLVIHGMDAAAGAVGVSESTGKCTPEYSVLTPACDGVNNKYFATLLRLMALRNYIYVICPSVRQRAPRFRFSSFKDVWLLVPPHGEQCQIVEEIETKTAELDALSAEAERAIELLQERRTALISAAVTGKIDVRESAYQETA